MPCKAGAGRRQGSGSRLARGKGDSRERMAKRLDCQPHRSRTPGNPASRKGSYGQVSNVPSIGASSEQMMPPH